MCYNYSLLSRTDQQLLSPVQGETILACGLANGSIALVRVSQRLVQSSVSPFGRNYRIECKATLLDAQPARSDGKGITALTWIESRTVCHASLFQSHLST